jgi:hypothetical protein
LHPFGKTLRLTAWHVLKRLVVPVSKSQSARTGRNAQRDNNAFTFGTDTALTFRTDSEFLIRNLYSRRAGAPSNLYGVPATLGPQRNLRTDRGTSRLTSGVSQMLDLLYITVGAAFLGACVLYAFACDRL